MSSRGGCDARSVAYPPGWTFAFTRRVCIMTRWGMSRSVLAPFLFFSPFSTFLHLYLFVIFLGDVKNGRALNQHTSEFHLWIPECHECIFNFSALPWKKLNEKYHNHITPLRMDVNVKNVLKIQFVKASFHVPGFFSPLVCYAHICGRVSCLRVRPQALRAFLYLFIFHRLRF